jgi:mannose-6-phosphate isomerase-like protein (cupin superfamily)
MEREPWQGLWTLKAFVDGTKVGSAVLIFKIIWSYLSLSKISVMKNLLIISIAAFLFVAVSCDNQTTEAILDTQEQQVVEFRDFGPEIFVFDIEEYTLKNENFRIALWTGTHMQLTLMSLLPGEEIGLESHPELDQFIRVESGKGVVVMGDTKEDLNFEAQLEDDFAFFIPAGKWHNIHNTGNVPLKLYSIYSPNEHPHGTIHKTVQEALEDEHHH